jgi:hypothetical protein
LWKRLPLKARSESRKAFSAEWAGKLSWVAKAVTIEGGLRASATPALALCDTATEPTLALTADVTRSAFDVGIGIGTGFIVIQLIGERLTKFDKDLEAVRYDIAAHEKLLTAANHSLRTKDTARNGTAGCRGEESPGAADGGDPTDPDSDGRYRRYRSRQRYIGLKYRRSLTQTEQSQFFIIVFGGFWEASSFMEGVWHGAQQERLLGNRECGRARWREPDHLAL